MALGIANTPLINYFFYKQTTTVSTASIPCCNPVISIADGGNGQLVVTTTADLKLLQAGNAITLGGFVSYDGDYSIISKTTNTFNISGEFVGSESGTWELASNTTGANAGDPLDFGQISFYDNVDQITPLDTYQDRELTIANPNPIILDALGSYPPIYLQDTPYYIVIKDKFNNLVATLDNYLPDNSISPSSSTRIENLFSNYGFDTNVDDNIYEESTVGNMGTFALSAGWRWEIDTTQTDTVNTYSYETTSASGLTANPKNALIINSLNVTVPKTTNQLAALLGDYNKFQNLQLGLSIYTELINGSATDLECELIRTRNGVDETPINIGSISISSSLTQENLIFIVPPLTDSNYSNDDSIRFVIKFPLNSDFSYKFTGTWLQISSNGLVTPIEESGPTVTSKEFFAQSFREMQSPSQEDFRGLPVVMERSGALTLNQTGSVFLAPLNSKFNYAIRMGDPNNHLDVGYQLLRDNQISVTQTNRLIDYLRSENIVNSRHTFVANNNGTNIATIQTGIGESPNSSWASLAGPRITLSEPTTEFAFKLKGFNFYNGRMRLTFVDNFSALTFPFNPSYTNGGGPVYDSGFFINSPVQFWMGTPDFIYSFPNTPVTAPNAFTYSFGQAIISGGSPTVPAEVEVQFTDVQDVDYPIIKAQFADTVSGGQIRTGTFQVTTSRIPNYIGLGDNSGPFPSGTTRIFYDGFGPTYNGVLLKEAYNLKLNYIGYNDISDNPGQQGINPPRLIKFTVDGETFGNNLVGVLSTLVVPLTRRDNSAVVGAKIVRHLNTSYTKLINIISTPVNADVVQISNDITDFNVIYWDTTQNKPSNPDARVPIYVHFTPAQSTVDIANSTASSINSAVMGIPLASDLGLEYPQHFNTIDMAYFMMI